ncbi:MAG: hypothetical protein ACO1RT_15105 [Planctomycetaceae bacterium]
MSKGPASNRPSTGETGITRSVMGTLGFCVPGITPSVMGTLGIDELEVRRTFAAVSLYPNPPRRRGTRVPLASSDGLSIT